MSVEERSFGAKPIFLSVALAVLIYVVATAIIGFEQVYEALNRVTGLTWVTILALSLASFAARFLRWDWLLRRCGSPVPRISGFVFYLSGFALTTTPGKIGETIRLWYLRKRFGVNYSRSAPIFLYEQVVDVLAVALLASLAVSLVFPDLGPWAWLALVVAGCVGAVIVVRGGRHLVMWMVSAYARRRKSGGDATVTTTLVSGERLRALGSPAMLITSTVIGLLAWLPPGIALFLILLELGLAVTVPIAIGIFSISLLAGVVSFFSGGLGTTEAALALLVLAVGGDPPVAVAAAIISRVSTLWFAVALGAVAVMVSTVMAGKPGSGGAS